MARLVPATAHAARRQRLAILAAVVTNTLSKIAIGAAIGRGAFAVEIADMALAVASWLGLAAGR